MSKAKKSTENKRRRSRTNYRPWLRLLKRVTIVAVVLVVAFLLWKNWDKIAPEALLDWTEQTFGDAQTGEGFPSAVNGSAVVDMAEVKQHLAVLDDTTLRFYNANAACVEERAHSFVQPTMHTAGNYVLLTELGGNRIRLDTRREIVLQHTIENRKIYATDLLSNGTVAAILNSASQSYVSELVVLNNKGEETFNYKSNKYLLTDVSLLPSGKKLAAVGSTADNGVLKSVLLVITLSNGEVTEYTGTNVMLHNVTYFAGGAILATGDREIWSLKHGDKEPEKLACEGLEPMGYAATSSLAGVALKRSGATDAGELWIFDAKGKRVQKTEYDGTFRSISGHGADVLLLTDRMLYEWGTAGEHAKWEISSDHLQAVAYRNMPLLLTLSELKRIKN